MTSALPPVRTVVRMCLFCETLKTQHVQLKCGHGFCSDCMSEVVQFSCPVCDIQNDDNSLMDETL